MHAITEAMRKEVSAATSGFPVIAPAITETSADATTDEQIVADYNETKKQTSVEWMFQVADCAEFIMLQYAAGGLHSRDRSCKDQTGGLKRRAIRKQGKGPAGGASIRQPAFLGLQGGLYRRRFVPASRARPLVKLRVEARFLGLIARGCFAPVSASQNELIPDDLRNVGLLFRPLLCFRAKSIDFQAVSVLPALGRPIGRKIPPGKCSGKRAICSYNGHADGVVF